MLPFFGRYRLNQIDRDLCQAFKRRKLQAAPEGREALDAGADLRDARGRRSRPLGAPGLRKLTTTFAAILEEAVEGDRLDRNPAIGRRMKVHVTKPNRPFLEMDELALLLEVAAEQDRVLPDGIPENAGPMAVKINAQDQRLRLACGVRYGERDDRRHSRSPAERGRGDRG